MSGLKDDIPTLLFYAPFALLKDTCEYLCRMMTGSVSAQNACLKARQSLPQWKISSTGQLNRTAYQ